jgi:hypothetical protein
MMNTVAMTAPAAPMTARTIAYWVTTALAAVAFAVPGVMNIAHAPHIVAMMAQLGYPPYFPTILGTWKVLAAVAILAPRLPRVKEWAYAGMIFDLTSAAVSQASSGHAVHLIVIPLVIAGVVATSWAFRPPERRLESPQRNGET